MKTIIGKVNLTIIMAAFLITLSISTTGHCGTKDSTIQANSMKSLINGINSQNFGLAQSSIYLAGYYGYVWAVDPLINILNDSSKETNLRVLAAYSLYMIDNETGIQAVKNASINDMNYILKGTCEFIYNKYINNNFQSITLRK
jgi:hypothetical protein